MKIGIITARLRYNYGGILQNYALQTFLKRMGHDVVTLDPNQYIKTNWATPLHVIKRFIVDRLIMRRDLDPIWEYRKNDELRKLESNTGKFIKKHIKVIKYYNINDVDIKSFDAFIVGSDQVWRPKYSCGHLTNMFLDFTEGVDLKRIAYAASFGTMEWEFTEEQTKECKLLLEKFDGISVREESGVDLCKHYFQRDAKHVLDPTMLLKKEDYMNISQTTEISSKEKQLFYYILDYDQSIIDLIEGTAQKNGMRAFTVNTYVDMRSKNDSHLRIQPPIEKWLKAFRDAEYVITDSFHGTVFSILNNKPFTVIVNEKRGSARLYSLLKMFDLGNRLYKKTLIINSPINWDKVNDILNFKREEANEFLSKYLNT